MDYYDEHGLDLQRAYGVVCLMVGSNTTKYAAVAAVAKLPATRQQTCVDDFLNAEWSWGNVLKPHLRSPDQPKTELKIVYGPGKGKYDTHAEIAQHIKLLEAIADNLSDRFVWRVPISLEMQACGESMPAGSIARSAWSSATSSRRVRGALSPVRTHDGLFARPGSRGRAEAGREAAAVRKQKSFRAKRPLR
jgi:hypothetical protein